MTEGIRIDSIPDLVKRISQEWKRKEKEAEAEKKKLEEELKATVQEEAKIKKELDKARKIVQKMKEDYNEAEAKIEREERERIEKEAIKEEDVRAGKASLKDFIQKGKSEKQITEEVVKQSMKELVVGLQAIRAKNLEIMKLEQRLAKTQFEIRKLIIGPGRILQQKLKELKDFADDEMGLFIADLHNSRNQLDQVKHRFNLTQGKSLTPGYKWDRMSPAEARKIAFDPILPQELISSLLKQLKEHEGEEGVSVEFYLGKGESPGTVYVSRFGVIPIEKGGGKWTIADKY